MTPTSPASAGAMRATTGRGWTASSIATNTMCDESVTWRSPVAAFSE
jgi:hypothetical protein